MCLRKVNLVLICCLAALSTSAQYIQEAITSTDKIILDQMESSTLSISSVVEWKFDYQDEKREEEPEKFMEFFFLPNGNLIEKKKYTYAGDEGFYQYQWLFEYNLANQLAKATQQSTYDPGIVNTEEYRYLIKERRKEIIGYKSSDSSRRTKTVEYYNKKQQHIKTIFRESSDSIRYTRYYKYDKRGNKVECKTQWPALRVVQQKNHDTDSNKTTQTRKQKEEQFAMVQQWRYDDNQRLVEKKAYRLINKGNPVNKIIYAYDDKSRLVELRTIRYDGRLAKCRRFTYNDKGLLFEVIDYYGNDQPVLASQFTYVFY